MAKFTEVGVEVIAKGTKKFKSDLDSAGKSVADFGKGMGKKIATGAKLAAGALVGVGAAAAAVGLAGVKAAVSFESAFAGVIKTTDGLTDSTGALTAEGERLRQGFRNLAMEVPTSVEELLKIGELGGQLGIANDDLIGFTRTIAAMGEATTLTTEEAAVGFAQIASVMGTSSEQIENMGSAVVALGNNFSVASERDILGFAQRIAGVGNVIGLTESQVFAIATAFSSVGIQAEAGGTAVQKVLLAMNSQAQKGGKQFELFAQVAGFQSAATFKEAWDRDPGLAFQDFVEGLSAAGDQAEGILEELELADQRTITAFLSLAGAGERLGETLGVASKAFEENTALTKEAEQRYATTEAQFAIFRNTIKDVAISIGDALLPFVNKLLDRAKPLIREFGERLPQFLNNALIPAIESVVEWLGEMLPKAIQIVTDFWNSTLKPTLMLIVEWLGQNIPKAIQIATDFWITVLRPALESVWDFIQNTVIPIIEDLIAWLADFIPIAIETARDFLIDTLLPAFQDVSDFITDTVIPIIQDIINWLEVNIPRAIDAAAAAWRDTFKPALEAVWQFIQDSVIPIIQDVIAWLEVNIPRAIDAAAAAWETIFKPALEAVGQFIQDRIIPIIQEIVAWLEEKIPVAIDVAAQVWEGILKPALAGVGTLIVDTIIPAITDVVSWLAEKIPAAIELARAAWEDILKPALGIVIDFLVDTAIPALIDIAGWLEEKIPQAVEAAVTVWEDTLQPAFEELSLFINDSLIPAFNDIVSFITGDLIPAFDDLAANVKEKFDDLKAKVEAIPGILEGIVESMKAAGRAIVTALWDGMKEVMVSVLQWMAEKAGAIADIFPFSEPRDPNSPLRGLKGAGAAIINNIRLGMEAAIPALLASARQFADDLRDIIEEATKGIEGVAPTQSELGKLLTGIGRVFGGLGGIAARRLKEQRIDPVVETVKNVEESLASAREELERLQTMGERGIVVIDVPGGVLALPSAIEQQQAKILFLEQARAIALADIRREQERILKLQKAQQDLQFLEQQFKLLALIEERGLDLKSILGDIKLGVDADARGLVDAMTRALQQVIEQSEEVLGISSPSEIFMSLGRDVMRGLAEGVKSRISLPEQAVSIATTRMIAAPAVAGSAMTTNQFNLGGNNINTGMDMATFESRVLRIVERAARR